MHIHILGICGSFMGGLAAIAIEAGHQVTGCDASVYPPMSDQLRALGIAVTEGYDAAQMSVKPDVFVVGNVVSRGNPLMEAILDAGAPYTSGPQWLAEHVLAGRHVLAVAGTHGKTTTTSMLAWVLDEAGRSPGFLIGGVPRNFGVSARLGSGDCFVIEADEYDTAFFDKRSKFVHYRPKTVVLNNLEYDHADIFADLSAIETQFHHLLRTVPAQGRVVFNASEAALLRVMARGCWSEQAGFGASDSPWKIQGADQQFDVLRDGHRVAEINWKLLGRHNQLNALAALIAAEHVGVRPESAAQALGGFQNVKRRLELVGTVIMPKTGRSDDVRTADIHVFDDFAHHPTAIRTTLEGLRRQLDQKAQGGRVLAVFEPRSNTMKLGTMAAQLPQALAAADVAFAYSGGVDWDVAAALAPMGHRAVVEPDLSKLVELITAQACAGDRIVVMSNGAFGGIHQKLLASLQAAAKSAEPLPSAGGADITTVDQWADLPVSAFVSLEQVNGGAPSSRTPMANPGETRHVLYLHGFRSSPKSTKARQLATAVAEARAAGHRVEFVCPQLPPSPREAMVMILQLTAHWEPGESVVIGSSLGGFYAARLCEMRGFRGVLINPAAFPARDLANHIGRQKSWHGDDEFYFKQSYVGELTAIDFGRLRNPARYFLLAAKGDEVLNYRDILARYPATQLRLVEGGDHAFSDFEAYLPEVMRFAGLPVTASPKD
jgi:UDP-N-acetylmuramate: L-alanyl-gamma-D-glutamyl-meso-diaminopimelate ligase